MNVNGYPFEFVTHYNNESYYYFLKDEDTIKYLISQFLEIIVGPTYKPFQDYGAQIMFKGSIRKPDQAIFPISSKKDENLVLFKYNEPIKKSLFPIKSIERVNKKSK